MTDPDANNPSHGVAKPRYRRSWKLYLILATVVAAIAGLAIEVIVTRPIRDALNVYVSLISIANRPDLTDEDRLVAASKLCTESYLRSHTLKLAPQGGIAGIPRNISKNFKAWREGPNVWICPTDRIGPIFQFVPEQGLWKFDGPVGILRPQGEIIRTEDLPNLEE